MHRLQLVGMRSAISHQLQAIARRDDLVEAINEKVGHLAGDSVLAETAELLAVWLGNVVDLLDPDVIVIRHPQIGAPVFGAIRAGSVKKHAANAILRGRPN